MKRIPVVTAALDCPALLCTLSRAQAQNWPTQTGQGSFHRLRRAEPPTLSAASSPSSFPLPFISSSLSRIAAAPAGIIGAAAGAAAEPDGYTFVVSSIASNVISPAFNPNPGYDGMRDFTHIAYLGGPPAVLIVHPSLGVTTYKDFVHFAEEQRTRSATSLPERVRTAFWSRNISHEQEHYKLSHIPYKGAGPAMTDLIARSRASSARSRSRPRPSRSAPGKCLPLAVTTEKRIPNFPDIPTLKESRTRLGGGHVVRAVGTRQASKRYRPGRQPRDAQGACKRKVIQDRLALDAIETKLMSPEEYTKFVQAETTRWAPVAKSLSAIVAKGIVVRSARPSLRTRCRN